MEAAGERERESEEYKMVACVFTYIKEPSWPFTYNISTGLERGRQRRQAHAHLLGLAREEAQHGRAAADGRVHDGRLQEQTQHLLPRFGLQQQVTATHRVSHAGQELPHGHGARGDVPLHLSCSGGTCAAAKAAASPCCSLPTPRPRRARGTH